MDLGDFETTIKVIVVGNGGVGKSSMTARYCKGVFTDAYKKTIGVDFLEKSIVVDEAGGESVKLMIWDTAGQEEFDSITSSYYRGAGACAIVFSTTDRASFDAVESWKRKVEDEVGPGLPMVLVQNKTDLLDQAAMTTGEAEAAARKLGLRLYRACVKDNVNVGEVFEYLAAQFIRGGGDTSGVSALPAAGDFRPGAAPPEARGAGSRAGAGAREDGKEEVGGSRPSSAASGVTAGTEEGAGSARSMPSGTAASGGGGAAGPRGESSKPSVGASAGAPQAGGSSAGSAAAGAGGSADRAAAPAPSVASAAAPAAVPAPSSADPASGGRIKLGQEPKGQQGQAKKKSGGVFALC